ncbi:unnamed protein product [Camellia sinensis]
MVSQFMKELQVTVEGSGTADDGDRLTSFFRHSLHLTSYFALHYLVFSLLRMFLYSIAWSSWVLPCSPKSPCKVPYAAAMCSLRAVFATPCLWSITSKQVGPNEQ